MKILVDTNILIDYVCHRDKFYESARDVFATAFTGSNHLFLTDLSYMNCIYVAKHYDISIDVLINILQTIQAKCSLALVNDDVMSAVLISAWKDKEDALQYHAALFSKLDCIVTRNPKDFQESTIPVVLPTEIL